MKSMMNWAILDDPRGSSTSASKGRPFSPRSAKQQQLPDPDSLLDHVDIAIANAEYAHATRHLALHFSPSPSKPLLHSRDSMTASGGALALPGNPVDSALKDVNSLDSTLNSPNLALGSLDSGGLRSTFGVVDAAGPDANSVVESRFRDVGTGCLPDLQVTTQVAHEMTVTTKDAHEITISRNMDPLSDSKIMDLSSSDDGYDPLAADTAYRAARSAIAEGNPQLALSLLHVALHKCPPDKDIALGKVQRLMASTLQELENKELSSAPIETST